MKFHFIILFLFVSISVSGQSLRNAAGLRGGISSGITYQHFYSSMDDLKLLLSFRDNGMQITGLMEHYEPVMINYQDQFFMYYGAGVHFGYTRKSRSDCDNYSNIQQNQYYGLTRPVLGANAIIGIEYRIESVPVTFGFDYKPFFEFFGNRFFRLALGDFAFTMKYQF
jgi:hypothetical protein